VIKTNHCATVAEKKAEIATKTGSSRLAFRRAALRLLSRLPSRFAFGRASSG